MQLVLASSKTDPTTIALDGFSDLIGKRALWRRRRSLEKEEWVEDKVEATATGTGGRHGAASAKSKEESGETVQEGDTPSPSDRGLRSRGQGHQKRTTWAEVVAAGGVNIPAVFNLLGLSLSKDTEVHRSRNRWPGTPKNAGASSSKEAPSGGMES
jgi:hypothetical protein